AASRSSSGPLVGLTSVTSPAAVISTSRTTLPSTPAAFASAGYVGWTFWTSLRSRAVFGAEAPASAAPRHRRGTAFTTVAPAKPTIAPHAARAAHVRALVIVSSFINASTRLSRWGGEKRAAAGGGTPSASA